MILLYLKVKILVLERKLKNIKKKGHKIDDYFVGVYIFKTKKN